MYLKYKNAILSHKDCFFCTRKNQTNKHVLSQIFDWFYLDCLFRRSDKISGKVLDHMTNPFMCERSNLYWPNRIESIFQETWNIKKIEKNEFETGDNSSFKITKIYFQKKSLCYFFGQRLEGTLPKYAPSIINAIDYPVYWTLIIILPSIGF